MRTPILIRGYFSGGKNYSTRTLFKYTLFGDSGLKSYFQRSADDCMKGE